LFRHQYLNNQAPSMGEASSPQSPRYANPGYRSYSPNNAGGTKTGEAKAAPTGGIRPSSNYMRFNGIGSQRSAGAGSQQSAGSVRSFHHFRHLHDYISLATPSLVNSRWQDSPHHLWNNNFQFSYKPVTAHITDGHEFLAFHSGGEHGSEIGYLAPFGSSSGRGALHAPDSKNGLMQSAPTSQRSGTDSNGRFQRSGVDSNGQFQRSGGISVNQPVTLGTAANGSLLGDATISNAFGLNLSSTSRVIAADFNTTIMVGGHLGANDTVVGGTAMNIHSGQMLTAAQYAAAEQVIGGANQQTLVVTNSGKAGGGLLTLEQGQTNSLSSLVVSRNVTVATVGYTSTNALNVTGTSKVFGTLDVLQSAANTGSTLDFGSLSVGRSGSVTDVLSNSLITGLTGASSSSNLFSSSSLNLNVINNVLNQGSINSSGALSIVAGGSISNISPSVSSSGPGSNSGRGGLHPPVLNNGLMQSAPTLAAATMTGSSVNLSSGTGNFTNTGLIAATGSNGNVLFNAPSAQNIAVNNTGGTIQALQGAIGVRDPTYTGAANVTLTGGDYLSQQVNLSSGTGTANVNIGNVTGAINISAGAAHVQASTANLIIGNNEITGDPTYFNTAGAVTIGGNITTSGNDLAIVAQSNITSNGTYSISTGSASGNGGNITMLAGVNFTSSGGQIIQVNNDTTSTLSSFSANAAGGYIDLKGTIGGGSAITSLTSVSTATNGSGGNISLIAFGGSGASAGMIALPSAVTVTSGGSGTGNNGSVTMIAGATSGTSITTGAITTTGGTGTGGNITLATATPTITGTPSITNGTLSGGSFTAGSTVGGGMSLGALTAGGSAGATVSATSGGALTTGAITDNGVGTNGPGGTVTLTGGGVNGGNFQVAGAISATGAGTGSGGTINVTSSNAANLMTLGSATGNSYISGAISATAGGSGTGGAINITNNGAGMTAAESIGASGVAVNLTANGTLTVNSAMIIGASGGNSSTAVALNANTITLTGTLNAGTGTVTLNPYLNTVAIDLGGPGTPGGLVLNSLGQITAGTLVVGASTYAGELAITNNINVAGSGAGKFNLTLNAGSGNIANEGGIFTITTTGNTLSLNSTSGNIGVNGMPILTSGATISVNTGSLGSAYVSNATATTLNASATGGNFFFTNAGTLTLGGNVTATNGAVYLNETSGGVNITSNGNYTISSNANSSTTLSGITI